MPSKPKKPKQKKFTLTLSEGELRRLNCYSAQCGLTRPKALQRIVRQTLRSYTAPPPVADANQLGLFDTLQIDIFNQARRVNSGQGNTSTLTDDK